MGRFTVRQEIQCGQDTFWKLFFDKEFNEKLYREGLGYPDFTIVQQTDTESGTVRKVTAMPKYELPGPVAKLLGSNYRYSEEGSFNPATKSWTWKHIPSSMADKLLIKGTVRIEPLGNGNVTRIIEVTLEAKIFGVGGLIESSFEKQMREESDRSATFTNQWLQSGRPT